MRKAADRLDKAKYGEGRDDYEWRETERCNCGFLAQVALRMNSEELGTALPACSGAWTDLAKYHCPTTGLPMDKVFRVLARLGMKPSDYERLEFLSDESLRNSARIKDPDGVCHYPGAHYGMLHPYQRKEKVSRYLRTWANQIEKELDEQDKKKHDTRRLVASVRKEVSKPLPNIVDNGSVATLAPRTRARQSASHRANR